MFLRREESLGRGSGRDSVPLATLTLDRVRAGEQVHPDEAAECAQLFAELADEFPGEHAYSYSLCALDAEPGHDRAIQLAMYYAEQLGRQAEVVPRAAAYLKANPHGALAQEARDLVSQAMASDSADDSMIDALAPAADASSQERVRALLDVADALVRKAKKHEAAAKFQEIVAIDPANNDAVSFLEGYLRQTRKYAELRDVLLNASKTTGVDPDARKGWLREIAGLCETQLRDLDGAIYAWKQLLAVDRTEEGPRTQLRRLLERAQRWDDLTTLLEQEAEQETDTEARISMEKSLAKLHEQKRKDPVAAGEAWARIASLALGDDAALSTAVKLFERGERADLAASTIADNVGAIEDEGARSQLYKKLGELREAAGEMSAAGDAFAEAGALGHDAGLWESAERCFVAAEVWDQAAAAVQQRAQLAGKPRDQAALLAKEADYLGRAGDEASAVLRLEQSTDLDPTNEDYAAALEERYALGQRTRAEDRALPALPDCALEPLPARRPGGVLRACRHPRRSGCLPAGRAHLHRQQAAVAEPARRGARLRRVLRRAFGMADKQPAAHGRTARPSHLSALLPAIAAATLAACMFISPPSSTSPQRPRLRSR